MAKVLYIEDNPDNMQLVQRVITALGHLFLWAGDGVSGISMAQLEHPDLILLDINLPDIDGHEVARRLRSHKNDLLHVPIIAITANALKGDAEKALAAGCDVYMSKPVNIRELRAQVMGFLPDAKVPNALG
ncbi:Polar-differentiation response regulator DivK [Thermoflexales bacterium]|nr:Polar-differentiation response regulator DivK [Thermoflexales bacterium]